MKRRLAKLGLLLLLGAIINIAVAWGCALFIDLSDAPHKQLYRIDGGERWGTSNWECAGAHCIISVRNRRGYVRDWTADDPTALVPPWTEFQVPTSGFRSGDVDDEVRWIDCRGWPIPTLYSRGSMMGESHRDRSESKLIIWGGWRLPMGPSALEVSLPRVLPWQPLWSGVALNTPVLATMLMVSVYLWHAFAALMFAITARQRAILVSAAVVLGALTTVAVAWCCAYSNTSTWDAWSDAQSSERPAFMLATATRHGSTMAYSAWRGEVGQAAPQDSIRHRLQVEAPPWASYLTPDIDGDARVAHVRLVQGCGWPMRALWCSWGSDSPMGLIPMLSLTHGIGLPRSSTVDVRVQVGRWKLIRALPVMPIWKGVLFDTLVFAMGWLLVISALWSLGSIRAKWRAARGCCGACGYDLRGTDHAICPECGASASKQS